MVKKGIQQDVLLKSIVKSIDAVNRVVSYLHMLSNILKKLRMTLFIIHSDNRGTSQSHK
jgi:hypothetical protein